jgi:DNA-binding ferritin-like protein
MEMLLLGILMSDQREIVDLQNKIMRSLNSIVADLQALPDKNLPPDYDPEAETDDDPNDDDDDESEELPLEDQLIGVYCNKKSLKEILEAMHRNTKGRMFYQDHLLLQRLYTEMDDDIDTLGEHILTYGGTLPGGITAIAENASIEETQYDVAEPDDYFDMLELYYDEYIEQLYDVIEEATEMNRQGTMLLLQNEIQLAEHHRDYLVGRVVS